MPMGERSATGGKRRRRPGRKIEDTSDLLAVIIECVADGLLLVDPDGIIQFANPAAAALFDRPMEELVATEFGFPIVVGETTEIELFQRRGSLVTVELRVSEFEMGSAIMRLISLRDITLRREAESNARRLIAEQVARQEAESARKRAVRLAEASRLLASSLDYETTLASVVEAVVPTLGDWCSVDMLTEDGSIRRLAGRHSDPKKTGMFDAIRLRYPPTDAPFGVPHVLRTGKAEFHDVITDDLLRQIARDEVHFLLLRGAGVRSAMVVPLIARGRILGAITLACEEEHCFDETDLHVAEDLASRAAVAVDNARLYQAAERASREAHEARIKAEAANASKANFLAMVSHELRTPLNAIGGYAQLMEQGLSGPVTETQHKYLQRVRRSQEHLESLINDVLDFAKLEAGRVQFEMARFPIGEALSAVVAFIEPQARAAEVQFHYRGGDDGLIVSADREKVLQVVLNLISNALKFTPAGGLVALDWVRRETDVAIRVSDNGRGVPADKLQEVFEPFVQAQPNVRGASEGTGLGLAISRDLARAMGGDITVESEVGVGSTFSLLLPLVRSQTDRTPPGISGALPHSQ